MATSASVVTSVARNIPAPGLGFQFETEENSPFPDGYSIAKEEKILAEFMSGDKSEGDPRYDRYMELINRRVQLAHMQKAYETNKGAEGVVQSTEVRSMDVLGALVDEEEDAMRLHTKEAYRMFMGRAREPGNPDSMPIVGGKRVAAALRSLWLMTANDNPYADWALLRHEMTIERIQKRLNLHMKEAAAQMEAYRKRGLTFSLLLSAHPQSLRLGFRSPYGYAVSTLIVDFDHYVRMQKTLARKNLRSDQESRQAIATISRAIRGVFYETVRFERWLVREEVNSLSRADFVPEAGDEAAKRVEFVTRTFGWVPADVYTARLQPRHSRRRVNLTQAERQLLQSVGEMLEQKESGAAAEEAAAEEAAPQEKPKNAAGA